MFEDKKIKNACSVLSFFIITIFFIYTIPRGYVAYETNDDFFLTIFPSGILGHYSPYTIFNNIVMGWIMAILNMVCAGKYNMGVVYFVACIYLSYISLCFFLTQKKNPIFGILVGISFFITTQQTLLCAMNYSKTGALVMSVGAIIFADNIISKTRKDKFFKYLGAVLLILGCLYRYHTSLAIVPFIAIYAFYSWSQKREKTKSILLHWGILLSVCISLWGINYSVYHLNSEWRTFQEFNELRVRIIDYGLPTYEENQEAFEEIGWTENDRNMLDTWQFADWSTFNSSTFRHILNMRPETVKNRETLINPLIGTAHLAVYEYRNYFIALLLIFAATVSYENLIVIVPSMCLTIAEVYFLFFNGRIPERAILTVLIPAFCTLVYAGNEKPAKKEFGIRIILAVVAVLVSSHMSNLSAIKTSAPSTMSGKEQTVEFLSDISKKEENLYVWNVYNIEDLSRKVFSPLDGLPYGLLKNSIFTGGWPVPSPVIKGTADKFGDGYQVFEILARNPHAFHVIKTGQDTHILDTYMLEHYGAKVQNVTDCRNGYLLVSYG